jgi:hypothetical protein
MISFFDVEVLEEFINHFIKFGGWDRKKYM